MAVTYPFAGNIGGGGFMILRLPNGAATTIDYRAVAPGKSTPTMYLGADGNIVRTLTAAGYLAPTVGGIDTTMLPPEQREEMRKGNEDQLEQMKDRVPRLETDKDGRLSWVVAGTPLLASPGLTATAGVGNFKNPPKNYEEMHPGAYDAKARLKYMDQMGIWAMIMYPNVGGFGAQEFLKLNDPELMLTCVQIYNDWQTEWASADSRRLLPITSLPSSCIPASKVASIS